MAALGQQHTGRAVALIAPRNDVRRLLASCTGRVQRPDRRPCATPRVMVDAKVVVQQAIGSGAAGLLSGALAVMALTLSPSASVASQQPLPTLTPNVKLLDGARVIPTGQVARLLEEIDRLEREQGWRVRVATRYQPDVGPSAEQLRTAWRPDEKTLVMLVDTSSPNIMTFRYGDGVMQRLRRPFFSEMSSRFGNQFYVRDNGESAAVVAALDTLLLCLGQEGGCVVVPGLPADQYYLTLTTSIAGGFVFGFASQLEPSGFVKRRWVWLVLFAPLWASLFINFGMGPILMRTPDLLPIIGNVAGFSAAAGFVALSPMFKRKFQEKP